MAQPSRIPREKRVQIVNDISGEIRTCLATLFRQINSGARLPGLSEIPPAQLAGLFGEGIVNMVRDGQALKEALLGSPTPPPGLDASDESRLACPA